MNSSGSWIDAYSMEDAVLIPKTKPPSRYGDYCAYTINSGLELTLCNTEFACGVCLIGDEKKWYQLKGVCKENVYQVKWYDVYYYMYGVRNNRPYFL